MMNVITRHVPDRVTPQDVSQSGAAEGRTLRVLAAVDKSECTSHVIDYLVGLRRVRAPMDVVLLNVQPEPSTGRLRGYGSFRRAVVEDRLVNDIGRGIVTRAAKKLDSAGIPHRDRIELGDKAETILRCARQEECDVIVLSEAPPGRVRRWLLRSLGLSFCSVTCVVLGLAQVPVVVAR
jgi:nucleotide-binding universal stress UspA family protein